MRNVTLPIDFPWSHYNDQTNEKVGWLLGAVMRSVVRVELVIPTYNYSKDPESLFDVTDSSLSHANSVARSVGMTVLGIAHSHPDNNLLPTEADRAGFIGSIGIVITDTSWTPFTQTRTGASRKRPPFCSSSQVL